MRPFELMPVDIAIRPNRYAAGSYLEFSLVYIELWDGHKMLLQRAGGAAD